MGILVGRRTKWQASLAVVAIAALFGAACSSGPTLSAEQIVDDQQLLVDMIMSERELLGPQLQPRVGTQPDALLDAARFLSAPECESPTGVYIAAAEHFTGFSTADEGLTGSLDLWLATFDDTDDAVAFHDETVALWNRCAAVFNETNLLQIEPFAVAGDLLGDGFGMGGVSARTTRVGTTRTIYTYQVPFDRIWARIRISHEDTAVNPEADRRRILQALQRALNTTT